jgi:hypothetical protein
MMAIKFDLKELGTQMAAKIKTKSKIQARGKSPVRSGAKRAIQENTGTNSGGTTKVRVVNRISPPRPLTTGEDRKLSKGLRLPQYAYMKAPGFLHNFEVGDTVEVYCDHEKNKDRVRGWIRGIVVQVDNKLVAVQFRSNVFLTDGWMVPDRILWYPQNSEHMRPVPGKKSSKKEKAIPDY